MRHIILFSFLLLSTTLTCAQTFTQWRDSLKTLNRQAALYPDSLELQLGKAAVNLQLLEWEDAIRTCNDILTKDKNNLSALYYRAYANNNLRRHELAKNDYERFVSMSPRNMEARLGLAYTYTKLDRNIDALNETSTLIELYPDSSIVYEARAEIEKNMKAYDAALYDLDEAIIRDPKNSDLFVSKVEILILLNRKKDAKNALDEAVRNGVPRGTLLEWYKKCK